MFRLTSLALITIAAGGVFAIRLLGQSGVNGWWVEGGLGFVVLAAVVGLWVRAVNQNAADRVAHNLTVSTMNENHAKAMMEEREYHRKIIDAIAAKEAAAAAALLAEVKEQSDEHKKRIEELERINKGSEHGSREA